MDRLREEISRLEDDLHKIASPSQVIAGFWIRFLAENPYPGLCTKEDF